MNILKRKCDICGRKDGNLRNIRHRGVYVTERWTFHEKCLRRVLCDPTSYASISVDIALEIIECIKEINEEKARKLQKVNRACLDLKEVNFDELDS